MDPRDRDDQSQAPVRDAGGENASAEERVSPAVVGSASLVLSGEGERREEAAAVEEEAAASTAVADQYGGVLTDGVVERRSQEGGEEEDGYVTPTSPRHQLQAPEVCPPAPRARSGEGASASVALTGERERREEAEAVEEEAAAPTAVADQYGGVLTDGVVEGRSQEGGEEEDGYVTPTSPRHQLQAPEVCPPAPRARSGEGASASVALTGERGRRDEAEAAGEEEASAPPAVPGDGGVLAEDVVEIRDHEGDEEEEDDGYVTPTSPSHRLQAPKVCPPAPRARLAPMPLSARRFGRALMMRELAASSSPRGRKRIQANCDPEEVVDVLMRSLRRRLFPPEEEKKDPM